MQKEVDKAFNEFKIGSSFRDPGYDYDFRKVNDSGKTFYRGGKPYSRPVGCMRYAIKVNGVYGDDTWLGSSNSPNGSPGEWAVAYHGTRKEYVDKIISSELRPGTNNAWGWEFIAHHHCALHETNMQKDFLIMEKITKLSFKHVSIQQKYIIVETKDVNLIIG